MQNFQSIKNQLFPDYLSIIPKDISEKLYALEDAEISTENFSFYTSVSSVFSSKIEGEEIELDSFVKSKTSGAEFQPDYTKKINDLYDAYLFAQKNTLTKDNLLKCHQILTRNILKENQQGIFRTGNMFVLTDDGKIEYVSTQPSEVESEMNLFFDELNELLQKDLTIEETFFYASLLHLIFVKIHPMNDGNGRLGRLIEKWFLAEKLGKKSWFLQSEKMYYENHQGYYNNLRKLGLEYENLDFRKVLGFLLMLPISLKIN